MTTNQTKKENLQVTQQAPFGLTRNELRARWPEEKRLFCQWHPPRLVATGGRFLRKNPATGHAGFHPLAGSHSPPPDFCLHRSTVCQWWSNEWRQRKLLDSISVIFHRLQYSVAQFEPNYNRIYVGEWLGSFWIVQMMLNYIEITDRKQIGLINVKIVRRIRKKER